MKKITTKSFLGLVFLLALIVMPAVSSAAVGVGGGPTPNNPEACIVWRTSMSPTLPSDLSYNGVAFCKGVRETNERLYQIEVALDALTAQISGMRGVGTAVAPNADITALVQRIASLEATVSTLRAQQPTSNEIAGCDKRTTGFSVLTGRSCIGNVPAKR